MKSILKSTMYKKNIKLPQFMMAYNTYHTERCLSKFCTHCLRQQSVVSPLAAHKLWVTTPLWLITTHNFACHSSKTIGIQEKIFITHSGSLLHGNNILKFLIFTYPTHAKFHHNHVQHTALAEQVEKKLYLSKHNISSLPWYRLFFGESNCNLYQCCTTWM